MVSNDQFYVFFFFFPADTYFYTDKIRPLFSIMTFPCPEELYYECWFIPLASSL